MGWRVESRLAVLEEKVRGAIAARDLQAKEYERRLTELNHAHQQQMDRNAQYVSREAWELHNTALDEWRREIDKWRWISIGSGIAGGGIVALIMRLLQR